MIGSVHEHSGSKTTNFPLLTERSRFTDDTVMTIAVADCLLHDKNPAATLRQWGRRFPARRVQRHVPQLIDGQQPERLWKLG